MAKKKEENLKVRCADFAVSYYVKLEPDSNLTSNIAFRTGRMTLVQKPDENLPSFKIMTTGNPGELALRITDEIEKSLNLMGCHDARACVINFWQIGSDYWREPSIANNGMDGTLAQ